MTKKFYLIYICCFAEDCKFLSGDYESAASWTTDVTQSVCLVTIIINF